MAATQEGRGREVWKFLERVLSEFEGPGGGPRVGGYGLLRGRGTINKALGVRGRAIEHLRKSAAEELHNSCEVPYRLTGDCLFMIFFNAR